MWSILNSESPNTNTFVNCMQYRMSFLKLSLFYVFFQDRIYLPTGIQNGLEFS